MLLKKFVLTYFGPFYKEAVLEVDERVTVLTGSNDSGKSAILNALQIAFTNSPVTEDEVNVDRIYNANTDWKSDPAIMCKATLVVDKEKGEALSQVQTNVIFNYKEEIEIFFPLAPELSGSNRKEYYVLSSNKKNRLTAKVPLNIPKIINLSSHSELNSTLNLKTPQGIDTQFLSLAFGQNGGKKLMSLSPPILRREIRKANKLLNKKFSDILPPSMNFEFELDNLSQNSTELVLNIQDKFTGYTPIHLRGTGIKKIISIITILLKSDINNGNVIFLYDEPENSLHADAQHLLRNFLENLSEHKNIQVIYATHSPAMINPLNCGGIRLIKRGISNDKVASSTILNRPIDDNFLPVRTSLGLSPVDSLLYAPITIIVEGYTEIFGLPILFKRLLDEQIDEFKNSEILLNQVRFIDGQGDSFEYWARL